MLEFRACPRCEGDLHLKQDYYGAYKECLQCGYSKDIQAQPRRIFTPEQLKGQGRTAQKVGNEAKGRLVKATSL